MYMQRARMIGNYVEYLAKAKGITDDQLCQTLDYDEKQVHAFFKGRMLATFSQLESLSELFEVSVEKILEGDEENYNRSVVHCMNQFQDVNNREKILDIIDDYIDIKNAVDSQYQ